ncbi:branched-chain amino acid ABC transporter permease [Pyrobaculum sp. 3827-6]|uniref:branched-chain amino acid ABC transporter permease n=1 Tax=Pyrobaculum sp. 3827-6 TaxID=2983604 RepID=UPI0021D9A721|nr:branched-chain amino acid ABC transporter permease [Pyrobaculum sp. 3827-6]MCU7787634.1 branched-chain amino acid ABC transporter permease [Pyrobaculum sp. 3827-6]
MRGGYRALAVAAALALAYLLSPNYYIRYEVAYIAAASLAVLGVVTLLDAGLVNFGYGMYVAVGAYTAALLYKYAGIKELAVTLPLSVALGAAVGLGAGALTGRFRGIFYALLNLSLAMVLYGALVKFYNLTGGSDGVSVPTYTILGMRPGLDGLFALSLAAAAAAAALRYFYVETALYWSAVGIRENEQRLPSMGVAPEGVVTRITVISAMLGSASGCLLAYLIGHVTPELAFWSYSTLLVISGVVGFYASTTLGFLIGTAAMRVINLAAYYATYELVIGAGLLAVMAGLLAKDRLASGKTR